MKQKPFNSIAQKRWRLTPIAVAFVLLALFGSTSSTAQSKNQKRVTSVRLGSANEGSRVTVVSDSALNDYEAYRRGDRFYVKIPAADFASGVPNLRGAGFEDVKVQKAGDGSIISFRLQPGTAARVDQRSNRLDVVFSTIGRSENSGETTDSVTGRPQDTSGIRSDGAVASPPSSSGSSPENRDSSSSNPNRIERQSQSTFAPQPSTAGSQQGSSGTSSQANPAVSSPGANEIATGSPSGASSTSESLLATMSPDQPTTVEQHPVPTAQGTIRSQTVPVRARFAGQWLARHWLLAVIAAVLLVSSLLFVVYRRFRLKRNNRTTGAQQSLPPKDSGNVGFNEPEFAAQVDNAVAHITAAKTAAPSESIVESSPLVPPTSETRTNQKTVEPQPTKSVLHSPEVKPLIAEQPLSNSHERVDFEVKKLLAGEEFDSSVINSSDSPTRQMIAAQLLTALCDRGVEQQEPARQAFLKHGYFDEATKDLRTADSPADRAAAARKLGKVGSPLATMHLIAALNDSAPEVRKSAVESLGQIADPGAIQALNALLLRENSRQLPEAVIRQAIESITVAAADRPAEKSGPRGANASYHSPVVQAYQRGALEQSSLFRGSTKTKSSGTEDLATPAPPPAAPVHQSVMKGGFAVEEERLRLQEEALLRASGDLERRRLEAEVVQKQTEDEASFLTEAETLRRAAEEPARRRSEAETARLSEGEESRGAEEEGQRLAKEARVRAEEEEQRTVQEELRRQAEEEMRLRLEEEAPRLTDEEARRRVEEQRLLIEAEERRRIAEVRLKLEQEALMQAAIELTRSRAEVEAARRAAEEESRLLSEAQEKMRIEDERRRLVEEERLRLEAEEQRRAQEVRRRVEEFARLEAEKEERRLAELDLVREQAQRQARQRVEQEQRIRAEIEVLRQAEVEQNKRIEVETRRRAAAEARLKEEGSRGQAIPSREQESLPEARGEEETQRKSESLVEETHQQTEQHHQAPWFDVPMDREGGEVTSPGDKSFTASAAAEKTLAPSHQFQGPVEEENAVAQENGLTRFGEDSSIPYDIFKRLNSSESRERAAALAELSPIGGPDVFSFVSRAFDDESTDVRNAAAHALYDMQLDRAASFTQALREGSPERRRRIGAALAASGLANNAINNLTGESREKTYDAFSLLFLMAKAGEVQPLMQAIEEHANVEVRLAVVKLLALSGQAEIVPAFRRLAVRGSLPSEVRSAVMEAIYQISSQARERTHSLAGA